MRRVLKPGGPLIVVVESSRSTSEALGGPKRRYERLEADWLVHYLMEEAGLTGVHAYPLLADGFLPRRVSIAWVGFKERVGR